MWSTEVQICANCELSDSHQPFFQSEGSQEGWFLKDVIFQTSTGTQLNAEQMTLKLPYSYENLINANVVTWINRDLGGKRMYARVKSMNWINANTTAVNVELDPFQTWMHSLDFRECFVEREMVEDDWNGSIPSYNNLVPEPISTTADTLIGESIDIDYNSLQICAGVAADTTGRPVGGSMSNNIYSGVQWYIGSAGAINALITGYDSLGLAEAIVTIFMCPQKVTSNTGLETYQLPSGSQGAGLDGYQPQNAKLFAYPFHYAVLTNQQGQTEEYRFESYSGPAATQLVFGTRNAFSASPQAMCYPIDYRGRQHNFDEGITLNCDMQCVWSSDTFKNWYAQNSQSQFIKGLGSALTVAGGVATGNPLLIGAGALGFGAMAAQEAEMSSRPAKMRGAFSSALSNAQWGSLGFLAHRMTLRADEAERIDKYFDAFGYATMQAKKPNIDTRPYWNYVKTRNSCVQGSFPQDGIDKINRMFNNGVTLWHIDKGAQIGNYDMDNRG